VEGVVVDKAVFRFAICRSRSIPEILAIKVESCQKSRRFLDAFSPSQNLAGRPSKSYTHFVTPASPHVAWKKFCEDTPTKPEVIGARTLNFKPDFKFLRLNFFWGEPPSQLWCALARPGESVTRVKFKGSSAALPPQGPTCSLPKNICLNGST